MHLQSWEDYMRAASVDLDSFLRCRQECLPALGWQKALIRGLMQTGNPRRIACLGAGYLSDLPLDEMIHAEAEVYLVDWVPRIAEQGFRWGLIEEQSGIYACLACAEGRSGDRYCAGFLPPLRTPHGVCSNFLPVPERPVWCQRFARGEQPRFQTGDVTAGRATHFARQALRALGRARSPEQAVRMATGIVRDCRKIHEPLKIPGGEMELVTSSMVLTQFDEEPFGYFLHRLSDRFGAATLGRRRERLEPALQALRDSLFDVLVEGHVAELLRLVHRRDGLVFVAAECFRMRAPERTYFLVERTNRALRSLGEKFLFDFEAVEPSRMVNVATFGEAESIVLNCVLRPL